MVELGPTVTDADIVKWQETKKELDEKKALESLLRKRIFGWFFRNPTEGTNHHELGAGWKLTATYPIDRKIDPGELQARLEAYHTLGIPLASIVEWEPKLKVGEYRKLTDEQRKQFDLCLTSKPGSPQMAITPPKE